MGIVQYELRGDGVTCDTLSASVVTAGDMVIFSTGGYLYSIGSTPAGRRPIGVTESDGGGANGTGKCAVTMFDDSKIFLLNLGSATTTLAGALVKAASATTVTQITASTDISQAIGQVVDTDATSDTDVHARFFSPGSNLGQRYMLVTCSGASTSTVFSFSVVGVPNMADALYGMFVEPVACAVTAITKATCSFTLTHTISSSCGVPVFRWGLETRE